MAVRCLNIKDRVETRKLVNDYMNNAQTEMLKCILLYAGKTITRPTGDPTQSREDADIWFWDPIKLITSLSVERTKIWRCLHDASDAPSFFPFATSNPTLMSKSIRALFSAENPLNVHLPVNSWISRFKQSPKFNNCRLVNTVCNFFCYQTQTLVDTLKQGRK